MTCFFAALSRAANAADRAFWASADAPAVTNFLKFLPDLRMASSDLRLATWRLMFCLAALMADLVLGIVHGT